MIKVLHPGILTTIQDNGRFGYSHLGIPSSGAMDMASYQLANAILNNKLTDAVLEVTFGISELKFLSDCFISITGADFSPTINGILVSLNKKLFVPKEGILTFGKRKEGIRTYVAIEGGIQIPKVLGSRSFYKGINEEGIIKKNMIIPTGKSKLLLEPNFSKIKQNTVSFTKKNINCFKGPEFYLLSKKQKEQITNTKFTISPDNNRMGYLLKEPIENSIPSILSSGVLPGTVQLTPSGKLIVLMRDSQVTGGYPRILQLTEKGINILAQKITGDTFNFSLEDY